MRAHIAFIIGIIQLILTFNNIRVQASDELCVTRKECKCTQHESGGIAAKCFFELRQVLEMGARDFPKNLATLEMTGGRELRFGIGVFAYHPRLLLVRVNNVGKILVQEDSFSNMTSKQGVSFEFTDSHFMIFERWSWRNLAGPTSCLILRVSHAIIQGQTFARLVNFTAVDVPKLELLEGAFWFERPKYGTDESTNITLKRVKIENLTRITFQSPLNVLHITSSEIKRMKPEAISTLFLQKVLIENSTIHRIDPVAFSGQTLIQTLMLDNVSIHEAAADAFLSGLSYLVINRCKLGTLHPGAFNVTLSTAEWTGNMFSKVHSKAVVLKQWSSLIISNNTFKKVETGAFYTPSNAPNYLAEPPKTPEFNFTGNIMFHIEESAFDFSMADKYVLFVENNFFQFKCYCDMTSKTSSIMAGNDYEIFETGFCWVDRTLAKCFQLSEGFANMKNFTDTVCRVHGTILCEEVQQDAAIPPNVPSVSAVDIQDLDLDLERERKILGSIFMIVVVGMLVIMVLSAVMWIGKKGHCKVRRFLLPSTNSLVDRLTRMFSSGGVTPAASISRISVHEYAELQRKMEEGKTIEDPDIPLEDKATQTLPEELTQELLQSLKEKLNDPENYSEARDMIEHLYDLIKVEENCNKNYRDSCIDDNVYDVIKPKRSVRVRKDLVSTGTRAPSPDKLQPYVTKATLVSEYMEPKDKKVHTYSELPARPDLLPDAVEIQPQVQVFIELPPSMANRPLPAEPTQL